MKKLYLLILLFVFASGKYSDAQLMFQKAWGGSADETAYGMIQTADHGFLVSGVTASYGAGGNDAFIIKLDSVGSLVWTKIIGGTGDDGLGSFVKTNDGGYIVSGGGSSWGAGLGDAYVIKLDATGNIQWFKAIGGAGDDGSNEVIQTKDGGYIFAGNTTSFGSGGTDMFVCKLSATGSLQWAKAIGGTLTDQGNGIAQNADGTYYVGGNTNSNSVGGYDMYLVKLDTSGNRIWAKTCGNSSQDKAWCMTKSNDGGAVLAGYIYAFGAGVYDFYVVKFDSSGTVKWKTSVGGAATESADGICATSDGGFVVAGLSNSFGTSTDAYVVKLNSNGGLVWTKTMGGTGNDWLGEVIETADGGLALCGNTPSYGQGGLDAYIIKMQANGNLCGTTSSGGTAGSFGSQDTGGAVINVIPSVIDVTPTTVTGGLVTTICTTIGIDEIAFSNSFSITPVPSHGAFTIKADDASLIGHCAMDVFNMVGEKVYGQNINDAVTAIKLNLPAGIYFMRFVNGDRISTHKVIIE